ncbi:unnamed protein product, partial [Polarella glacialis]
ADPLLNPLRAVLTGFTCAACGRFDAAGGSEGPGGFACGRCAAGICEQSRAYASLIYGDSPQYVAGALALGYSLEASGTQHDRVLLHTHDVPEEALQLLGQLWKLQKVAYVSSAADLHVASERAAARFRNVFTKLQIFNPAALPYDRVAFLDLDMIVLRNVDELFEVRPPAAMSTGKRGGFATATPGHGRRMDPRSCYVNAGTMVVAPSQELFELLVADVHEPDPQWHHSAWSPEQSYLSSVMAGEWSHVSQLYNFEVQLHSGVPLSQQWQTAKAMDVAVAHFSGKRKVWEIEPDEELPVLACDYSR